jgi:hypothetical protein
MRGDHREPHSIFSDVSPVQRIPPDHPPRAIRALATAVLDDMWREFDRPYARTGRPAIPSGRCGHCCCNLTELRSVTNMRTCLAKTHAAIQRELGKRKYSSLRATSGHVWAKNRMENSNQRTEDGV